jgi:hypothetical protein
MNETPNRFAYRCLPIVIANQAGWLVLNRFPIQAIWDGSNSLQSVTIKALGDRLPAVSSHFGSGILTWNLPFLFRTSPGYNLLVRGPANWPKDGVSPLEGLVETDWSPATFTMNWQITRPNHPVVFEPDEPICMLVPQRRGELEAVHPTIQDLAGSPELASSFRDWSASRSRFLRDLSRPGSKAQKQGWQRDYILGKLPDGRQAVIHQTKLSLKPFEHD